MAECQEWANDQALNPNDTTNADATNDSAVGREPDTIQAMAICGFGLESVVARELNSLGFEDAKPADTGCVRWTTDAAGIVRANLWLRTADHVLIVVDEFEAGDFDALFEGTKAADWSSWIEPDGAFPVRARSVRSQLSSVPAVTRAVKRAVAESLLSGHDVEELPETGALYSIQARLVRDRLMLLLDTSGAALHKRGYRRQTGQAPLRETLAAALLSLCRWRPDQPLIDPCCGSGTIPIEAALIATNTAPGLHREFDAQRWGRFPAELWDHQRELARAAITLDVGCSIAGYDLAEEALVASRRNAQRAGVDGQIHFQQRPLCELRAKADFGLLVTNPPYGVRLEDRRQAEALLRTMPGAFRGLSTWTFGVLTDHEEFERLIGQEASKRRKLYNGSIQCTLFRFDGPRPPRKDRLQDPSATLKPAAFGTLRDADEHRLDEFDAVMTKRWRHLRKWPQRGIEAYRVYDHDVPGITLSVDRYGQALRIVGRLDGGGRSLAQQAELMDRVADRVTRITGVEANQVFIAGASGQRHEASRGSIHEHGMRLRADLSAESSTGLELGLRAVRDWVRQHAEGKRVLNLFCGEGACTVAAALGKQDKSGGAASSVSVDVSEEALGRTAENLRLNTIETGDRHELDCCEVKEFVVDAGRMDERYDLIVVCLPRVESSLAREMDWNNQRDHTELLTRLGELLLERGLIVLTTSQRSLRLNIPEPLSAKETTTRFCPDDFRSRPSHRSWLISSNTRA